MMSGTLCMDRSYDKRSANATGITMFGADEIDYPGHCARVLTSAELLAALRRLKEDGEASNSQIAQLLGLPSPRVAEIFSEKRRITIDEMKVLVEHFGLAAGADGSSTQLVVADNSPTRSVDGGETAVITRLDLSLPMGPGATVDDYVEDEPIRFDLGYVRSFTRTPLHRLRIAQGVGDSMFPTLMTNDMVIIDTTQNQLLHSDRIYAASINGGAAIKRLRPTAGGRRILVVSDNKAIDAYEVDADEVVIWGRVIRFARDL